MRARIMLALDVFDLHVFIAFVCMFWLYNFLYSGCCSEGFIGTTTRNDDVSLAQDDHLAHPAYSAHLAHPAHHTPYRREIKSLPLGRRIPRSFEISPKTFI